MAWSGKELFAVAMTTESRDLSRRRELAGSRTVIRPTARHYVTCRQPTNENQDKSWGFPCGDETRSGE